LSRIGITGHMDLTPAAVPLVDNAIRSALARRPPQDLTGISCIAAGADSIFARAILDAGGKLEVVLPSSDYRKRIVAPDHADLFDDLVRRASSVRTMPYSTANRDAYEAANEAVLSSSDELFAVWDGRSPADKGGTAAVIESAHARGMPVEIIWPEEAARR
jgi:hypothetical protein